LAAAQALAAAEAAAREVERARVERAAAAERARLEAFEAAKAARARAQAEEATRVEQEKAAACAKLEADAAAARAEEEAKQMRLEALSAGFKPLLRALTDAVQFKAPMGEVEAALLNVAPILHDPTTALLALECGTAAALMDTLHLYIHYGPELEAADSALQSLITPLRAAKRVAQETEGEVERLVALMGGEDDDGDGEKTSHSLKSVETLKAARKAQVEATHALGLLEDEIRGSQAAKDALEGERVEAQRVVQLAVQALSAGCSVGGVRAARLCNDKGVASLLARMEREFPGLKEMGEGGGGLVELQATLRAGKGEESEEAGFSSSIPPPPTSQPPLVPSAGLRLTAHELGLGFV